MTGIMCLIPRILTAKGHTAPVIIILFTGLLKKGIIHRIRYGKRIGFPKDRCFYVIGARSSKIRKVTVCLLFFSLFLSDLRIPLINNLFCFLIYHIKFLRQILSFKNNSFILLWQIAEPVNQDPRHAYRHLIRKLWFLFHTVSLRYIFLASLPVFLYTAASRKDNQAKENPNYRMPSQDSSSQMVYLY